MSENDPAMISSSIEGLDEVLLGGLLAGGFYLVQGDPGAGKTTLALQFILGRVRAGEKCLYFSLTETRRDIERTCRAHAWSLDGLEVRHRGPRSDARRGPLGGLDVAVSSARGRGGPTRRPKPAGRRRCRPRRGGACSWSTTTATRPTCWA